MRKWFLIMATAVVLCSACGKKDASVNDATQAAQASSTEAENLYKEGSQYVGEEDYESAIESLLKCIELDPDYSKAYIQLSKAYIGNEEYDEAMSILQQGYEKTKDTSLEKEQDNCVRTICQVLTDNEITRQRSVAFKASGTRWCHRGEFPAACGSIFHDG